MLLVWGCAIEIYVLSHVGSNLATRDLFFLIVYLKCVQWAANAVMKFCLHVLFVEKMRRFAGDKFESWEDFTEWLKAASPAEIERLAGIRNGNWTR